MKNLESKEILQLWASMWPKSLFDSEEKWLIYCRKWSKRLESLTKDLETYSKNSEI